MGGFQLAELALYNRMLTEGTDRRKSLFTDVGRITTPTFSIGGWNDLFTNSEARMLSGLKQLPDSQKKLIMDDGYHVTTGARFGTPGNPPKMNVLSRAWYRYEQVVTPTRPRPVKDRDQPAPTLEEGKRVHVPADTQQGRELRELM